MPVLVCLLSVVASGATMAGSLAHPSAGPNPHTLAAARGVLERFIGPRAREIELGLIAPRECRPTFEIEARAGRVTVRGSDGVALCRGAYTYLRDACGCMFSWGGKHVALPEAWPDYPARRVVSPNRYLLIDNICTPGYTTAFYGWAEWERYLDWAALHGYNLEMAPLGAEAIWKRVWLRFGLTEPELDAYFTGPAFLPWHRMGNINKHDGPLPESYLRRSVTLQKQILARMRGLGIEPIAPAFSGFVPAGFRRAHPEAEVLGMPGWCGFTGDYAAHVLHPLSPLYPEIGGAFIREWRREFGDARFYQADSFNEMDPPTGEAGEALQEQLAAFGEAVYSAIRAGDRDGTWVMMAWCFLSGFWTPDNAAALLSRVPDDRMILLDLYCDGIPQWSRLEAYRGKQWIYSVLPNWGGNSQPGGRLGHYASTLPAVRDTAGIGNCVGVGCSPEGTENNDLTFELIADAGWADGPIDLDSWFATYARARYGSCPEAMLRAWALLLPTVYSREARAANLYQVRPGGGSYAGVTPPPGEGFAEGVRAFLSCAPELAGSELYRNDALELATYYLGFVADQHLRLATELIPTGDTEAADREFAAARETLGSIDRLLASHSLWRVSRWVGLARAWARDGREAAYYAQDAKRQITVWGGPVLSEYACRTWSGLVGGYYAGRWRAWYEAQRSGEPVDLRAWEERWITRTALPATRPYPEPLAAARELVGSSQLLEPAELDRPIWGERVGEWRAGEVTESYAVREWDVTAQVTGAGTVEAGFRYTHGNHRLDVEWVELLRAGSTVARDEHFGRTGIENVANRWRLPVAEYAQGARYTLRASIRSAGGTDSNGEVWVRTTPLP